MSVISLQRPWAGAGGTDRRRCPANRSPTPFPRVRAPRQRTGSTDAAHRRKADKPPTTDRPSHRLAQYPGPDVDDGNVLVTGVSRSSTTPAPRASSTGGASLDAAGGPALTAASAAA